MRQPFENNIDLTNYVGKCESCGSPARMETGWSEISGAESWQVCINPKCWQFDSWLKQKREILEAEARESKAAERNRQKLWAHEIAKMNRQKRKLRAAIARS
jgi:hypothetical protein